MPKNRRVMSAGATKIKKCTCAHKYQDKKYGKNLRVHNEGGTKDKKTFKCTVCGVKKK